MHAEIGAEIEARERLAMTQDIAAGTGNLKRHDQRAHIASLRRTAQGQRRRSFTRDAAAVTPESLASLGIEVVEERVGDAAP